jgi:hypothetical protein
MKWVCKICGKKLVLGVASERDKKDANNPI